MKQISVSKVRTNPKVRRLTNDGVWEVQSSRYPQLWYRVILDMEGNRISCGCKAWKFHSCEGCCKHMLAVMEAEA